MQLGLSGSAFWIMIPRLSACSVPNVFIPFTTSDDCTVIGLRTPSSITRSVSPDSDRTVARTMRVTLPCNCFLRSITVLPIVILLNQANDYATPDECTQSIQIGRAHV